jgi:hypothetical protein
MESRNMITAQHNWRWCSKCQGLWYSAAGPSPHSTGKCPGGGGHEVGISGDYVLYVDPDKKLNSTLMGQRNWRWCAKCQGLWYAAAGPSPHSTGKCPAGGGHEIGISGDYVLLGDTSGNVGP